MEGLKLTRGRVPYPTLGGCVSQNQNLCRIVQIQERLCYSFVKKRKVYGFSYRARKRGEYVGAEIGLISILKELMEGLGGAISLMSQKQ